MGVAVEPDDAGGACWMKVELPDRTVVYVELPPEPRGRHVKMLLESEVGIPQVEQRLLHDDSEVGDHEPVSPAWALQEQPLRCLRRASSETGWLLRVSRNGLSLQQLPQELKHSRALALAAVQANGLALRHASDAQRGDRKVVLAAVRNDPLSLEFASEELRNDDGVVMVAVQGNGMALQHASGVLQLDRRIVRAAVDCNWRALRFASSALRHDDELVVAAARGRHRELRGHTRPESDSSSGEELW